MLLTSHLYASLCVFVLIWWNWLFSDKPTSASCTAEQWIFRRTISDKILGSLLCIGLRRECGKEEEGDDDEEEEKTE